MDNYNEKYFILNEKSNKNFKDIKKLQRLVYLLINNVKIYKGKKGGYYYLTKNSKIYI